MAEISDFKVQNQLINLTNMRNSKVCCSCVENSVEMACVGQEIELTAAGRPQLLPEEVELKALDGVCLNKHKRCVYIYVYAHSCIGFVFVTVALCVLVNAEI